MQPAPPPEVNVDPLLMVLQLMSLIHVVLSSLGSQSWLVCHKLSATDMNSLCYVFPELHWLCVAYEYYSA